MSDPEQEAQDKLATLEAARAEEAKTQQADEDRRRAEVAHVIGEQDAATQAAAWGQPGHPIASAEAYQAAQTAILAALSPDQKEKAQAALEQGKAQTQTRLKEMGHAGLDPRKQQAIVEQASLLAMLSSLPKDLMGKMKGLASSVLARFPNPFGTSPKSDHSYQSLMSKTKGPDEGGPSKTGGFPPHMLGGLGLSLNRRPGG